MSPHNIIVFNSLPSEEMSFMDDPYVFESFLIIYLLKSEEKKTAHFQKLSINKKSSNFVLSS